LPCEANTATRTEQHRQVVLYRALTHAQSIPSASIPSDPALYASTSITDSNEYCFCGTGAAATSSSALFAAAGPH
jgi:hypothetical protein